MQLTYEKGKFKRKSLDYIKDHILSLDFVPIMISNTAGFEYHPHQHEKTKLLAFVEGTMQVTVDNTYIECKAGDFLIIPGDVVHSATVGKHGCRFFWSEKII